MNLIQQLELLGQYRANQADPRGKAHLPSGLPQPGLDQAIPGLEQDFAALVQTMDWQDLEAERALLLHDLQQALKLEHATIPPYLTALYTLSNKSSWHAQEVLRSVVVEEMLHMTLVANLINALGGSPDTAAADFMPDYPSALPFDVDGIKVNLLGFSRAAVEQGCAIERPRDIRASMLFQARPAPGELTIGEFYLILEARLRAMVERHGEAVVFIGDTRRQVREGFYYDGAGATFPITDTVSALLALQTIRHQGEGVSDTIWTGNREQFKSFPEVAHYFRFNELLQGRLYQRGDTVQSGPTGKPFEVDWEAAIKIKPNSKLADYRAAPEIHAHALAFNTAYCDFLRQLNRAYNGEPALLQTGIGCMFSLKELILRLVNNPLPGSTEGWHAAPTFEYAAPGAAVASPSTTLAQQAD
ncbi:ferritin-like protein [Chromobacterium sp. IIBBL 290-4]|uniref:ferritin-like domain-containing protein n=1 Tax=Chromobacterium sp. IIBBL 290-4 TaxID=2953890 RepID=UPI0020B64DA5|nr:ferritin-like protein [Chromobacterium sp. IIBBL 290-4]UTH75178.1 ferritin-like protein [Chromobacterium sp. IIBBL 290-4]